MNKTVVAVAVVAGILGFSLMWFGILPQLVKQVSPYTTPIVNTVKPVATAIYNGWISIPSPIRNILLAGIPTMFAIFFAWTKTRAMKKLQETQLETKQVLGEKQATLQHLGTVSQEKAALTGQLDAVTKENALLKQYQVSTQQLLDVNAQLEKNMDLKLVQQADSLRADISSLTRDIQALQAELATKKPYA